MHRYKAFALYLVILTGFTFGAQDVRADYRRSLIAAGYYADQGVKQILVIAWSVPTSISAFHVFFFAKKKVYDSLGWEYAPPLPHRDWHYYLSLPFYVQGAIILLSVGVAVLCIYTLPTERLSFQHFMQRILLPVKTATFPLLASSISGYSEERCAICLNDFATGDELASLACNHFGYHFNCLVEWLMTSVSMRGPCPTCGHME